MPSYEPIKTRKVLFMAASPWNRLSLRNGEQRIAGWMFRRAAKKFLLTPTLILLLFSLFLGGCAVLVPKAPPRPIAEIEFLEKELTEPLIDDTDLNSLQLALEQSLLFMARNESRRNPQPMEPGFPGEMVFRSLTRFKEILQQARDERDLDRSLREHFRFWQIKRKGQPRPILLTGYYEPILEGSLEPRENYLYPIYRRPSDLVELPAEPNSPAARRGEKRIVRIQNGETLPYYSREEIDRHGVLKSKGYELLWLKDPWERYVLHVQGSGQIRLPDGQILRVGYAGSNGRPYRSVGRVLIERGFLSDHELSLARVQQFFREYPQLMEEISFANERYIFFRILSEEPGPIGALGLPVTPGRSVAVDFSIFPRGALAYLISNQPLLDADGRMIGKKRLRRFVLLQDTGAAMRGPERVDLFIGSGEAAGKTAGSMKDEGEIYILLSR